MSSNNPISMWALHSVSNLKKDDWTDFQSNTGKWYNAKVTNRRDDHIELEWIEESYSMGPIYGRFALEIKLKFIFEI